MLQTQSLFSRTIGFEGELRKTPHGDETDNNGNFALRPGAEYDGGYPGEALQFAAAVVTSASASESRRMRATCGAFIWALAGTAIPPARMVASNARDVRAGARRNLKHLMQDVHRAGSDLCVLKNQNPESPG